MLKLILGRAKSGKTAAVMETIRTRVAEHRGGVVLLIPEQYSHEAERELLRVCGDTLCLYAEVLSFTRVCARVEAELGGAGARTLDAGGRLLCLARAVDAVGSRLRIYGAARRQIPLQQRLLRAIDECKTGRVTPEALTALAESDRAAERSDALGEKLRDLALVYEAYEAVAAQSGLDPMDRLDRLADRLPESRYGQGCYFVDGFTDFTAQQLRVLETILRAGGQVTVCLTTPGLTEGHEIFEPSRKAALALLRLAEGLGVPTETVLMPAPEGDGPMEVLERELFAFGTAHWDAGGRIKLCCAESVTAECEAAAARCLALVRETGCRWRDVAVTARDYERYRAALEQVFAHYGVPLYAARRSDLAEKPLPALIGAAYAAVNGGWDYEDVFAYLKTGLAGLDRAECDALENYVFLWSLRGTAWTKNEDWTLHPRGFNQNWTDGDKAVLEHINALRRKASGPLLVLARQGAAAKTAREQVRALTEFFDALDLRARLAQHARVLRQQDLVQTAAEYAQLWELTGSALAQCQAILGDAEMDSETFGSLFGLVLSAYDVGSIPLRLDRVGAGDMTRMRRRHIRHLIVLGCDSDSVPRVDDDGGIFSDDDREALAAAGTPLGDSAAGRLDREFALLYNCLTLPGETLTLSWCAAGAEGARAMPAFVVNRCMRLFSLQAETPAADEVRAAAPGPAFELAAAAVAGRHSPLRDAALDWFRAQGRQADLERLAQAARLDRGRLSHDAVRALYGDKLRLSASRVDKLSDCRFSYFLKYGLNARPRQPAEFEAPEMGTFLHFVLEGVAREIQDGGGFAAAAPETVAAICDKYVERYVKEKLNDFHQRSPRFVYLFRRLTRDVRAIVADMVEELAAGEFVPRDFELDFGDREAFPPVVLGQGGDSLTLTGVADRVDGYVHDGRLYVRVVDYKTGKKSFSLSDVWYGMGLQMLLYLFALERSGKQRYGMDIVPAGVLYVPARDVLVSARAAIGPEEILREKAKAKKRSGLLLDDGEILAAMERGETPRYLPVRWKDGGYSGDALATAEQLGQLARHVDKTLQDLAALLRSGSIAADPWFRAQTDTACRLCDYAAVCHFDEDDDACVRYVTRLKNSQVWDRLREGGQTP